MYVSIKLSELLAVRVHENKLQPTSWREILGKRLHVKNDDESAALWSTANVQNICRDTFVFDANLGYLITQILVYYA